MHRHDPSGVYYVIDGEFTFYVHRRGRHVQRRTAKTGETVPLTGGTTHTVRNESSERRCRVRGPRPRGADGRLPHAAAGWPRPARSAWNRCWLSPLRARHRTARPDPIHPLDPDPGAHGCRADESGAEAETYETQPLGFVSVRS